LHHNTRLSVAHILTEVEAHAQSGGRECIKSREKPIESCS